jgi:cytochrome c553
LHAFAPATDDPLDYATPLRMPMTPTYLMSVLAVACLLCASAQAQTPAATAGGDPAKGREKTRMCEGCHEIPGWRTAFPEVYHVPKIAGQHEAYIVAALKEYRSGERTHPSMRGITAPLTDQDIADLAAYYARGLTRTASQ